MSAALIYKILFGAGHAITPEFVQLIRSKRPSYWAGRIFMAAMYCILAVCLVAIISKAAHAQTTVIVQPDQYQAFADIVKRNREQMEAAGQQAGRLINGALRKPQAVAMILTIKCGKYVEGTVIYDNNTTKVLSIDPTPATDTNIAAVRIAFPNVHVAAIDTGC